MYMATTTPEGVPGLMGMVACRGSGSKWARLNANTACLGQNDPDAETHCRKYENYVSHQSI